MSHYYEKSQMKVIQPSRCFVRPYFSFELKWIFLQTVDRAMAVRRTELNNLHFLCAEYNGTWACRMTCHVSHSVPTPVTFYSHNKSRCFTNVRLRTMKLFLLHINLCFSISSGAFLINTTVSLSLCSLEAVWCSRIKILGLSWRRTLWPVPA